MRISAIEAERLKEMIAKGEEEGHIARPRRKMDTRISDIEAERLKEMIAKGEEEGRLAVCAESSSDILTDDFDQDRYVNYHIGEMSKGWLRERLIFAPGAKKYRPRYADRLISLLQYIDPDMLVTLQAVYIISNEEDAMFVCSHAGTEFCEFPEIIDFESHDTLGCCWRLYDSIIINMTAIRDTVAEMKRDTEEDGCLFDRQHEEDVGVFTTLTHEARHLGLSNPLRNKRKYRDSMDTEQSVEEWGRRTYESWLSQQRKETKWIKQSGRLR